MRPTLTLRRLIWGLRTVALVLIAFGLAKCGRPTQAPSPEPRLYTVSLGAGDSAYNDVCDFVAFRETKGGWETSDGIFQIVQPEITHNPVSADELPFPPPTEGASLSGNFDGFGRRTIRDESANQTYSVEIVYHATTYSAVLNRMRQLDCFR